jgi:hypothetical protein
MKLPELKKETIKIVLMAVIGSLAVLYAVVQLVVKPLATSFRANSQKLAEIRDQLDVINRELDRAPRVKSDFAKVTKLNKAYFEHNALHPVLGTYLIGVQDMLQGIGAAHGVQLDTVTEIGVAEIPGKTKDGGKRVIKSYGAHAGGSGGYNELTELIEGLTHSNSLACLSELTIIAKAGSPEKHTLALDMQWPIWEETAEPTNAPAATNAASAAAKQDSGGKKRAARGETWE